MDRFLMVFCHLYAFAFGICTMMPGGKPVILIVLIYYLAVLYKWRV